MKARIGERGLAYCKEQKAVHAVELARVVGCSRQGAYRRLKSWAHSGLARVKRNGKSVYFVF